MPSEAFAILRHDSYASCDGSSCPKRPNRGLTKMSLTSFLKTTAIGRAILIPWRLKNALATSLPPVGAAVTWAFRSREHYNFTYNLTERNKDYLAAFLSLVTKSSFAQAKACLEEIEGDSGLRSQIAALGCQSDGRYITDREVRYGRRIGWYALVRLLKPACVIETGVDKGLGTAVLAAAIHRNAREGSPGKVVAIDINPAAGFLVGSELRKFVDFRFKDSLAALREFDRPVDIFIHDSNHSADHERLEYEAVQPRLSRNSLVVSDNAAHTGELLAYSLNTGREFLFFAEQPKDHWWPGEGIGVAFNRCE